MIEAYLQNKSEPSTTVTAQEPGYDETGCKIDSRPHGGLDLSCNNGDVITDTSKNGVDKQIVDISSEDKNQFDPSPKY